MDLENSYFSPNFVEVTYKGTYEPHVTWLVNDGEYDDEINTNLEIPSNTDTWTDNSITFRINIATQDNYNIFSLKAHLSFTPSETTEVMETKLAKIYKRGRQNRFQKY